MFIVSDDMIPYILSNKMFNPIILFFSSKNVIMLKNDLKNVIDATLASDNPSCFRKKWYSMIIDDKIRDKSCKTILTEKQQNYQLYHLEKLINMRSYRWRNTTFWSKEVAEQNKFTYLPLGKALEKQRKTIEDQDIK